MTIAIERRRYESHRHVPAARSVVAVAIVTRSHSDKLALSEVVDGIERDNVPSTNWAAGDAREESLREGAGKGGGRGRGDGERERERERQRQTNGRTDRDKETDGWTETKKQSDSPWSAVPIAARPSPKQPP